MDKKTEKNTWMQYIHNLSECWYLLWLSDIILRQFYKFVDMYIL